MTAVYPEGTPTLGNIKVVALVDIPDDLSSISKAEILAGVDVSCYLYPAGWAPTGTTAKGTKPARLCSKVTLEQLNRTTFTFGDLQYVYDPQGAPGADGNELFDLLVDGTEVVFVERRGLDAEDEPYDTGDRYRAHHMKVGAQIDAGDPTDENAEFYIQQAASYVNAGPVRGVVDAS